MKPRKKESHKIIITLSLRSKAVDIKPPLVKLIRNLRWFLRNWHKPFSFVTLEYQENGEPSLLYIETKK